MAGDQQQAGAIGGYAAAVANLRSTAKWVMGSLAAVGAVLVTGLSLTSLSDIDDRGRLIGAAAAVLVALVVICLEVWYTGRVLEPSAATLEDVVAAEQAKRHPKSMEAVFARREALLAGTNTNSFKAFREEYIAALAARISALEANYSNPQDDATATAARAAQERAVLRTQLRDEIVTDVAYHEIKDRLSIGLQAIGGIIVAFAVAAFALLLAWPTDPPDRAANFHGARLEDADLSGASLVGASFSKMTLRAVDLHGADLRGADFRRATLIRVDLSGAKTSGAHWDHAVWRRVVCPDGTGSNNAGWRCRGHLAAAVER